MQVLNGFKVSSFRGLYDHEWVHKYFISQEAAQSFFDSLPPILKVTSPLCVKYDKKITPVSLVKIADKYYPHPESSITIEDQ